MKIEFRLKVDTEATLDVTKITGASILFQIDLLIDWLIDWLINWLIVLGFNDTSTLVDHFVSLPIKREKRDRKESRGDERER